MGIRNVTRIGGGREYCVKCGIRFLGQQKFWVKDKDGRDHGPHCPECHAELTAVKPREHPRDFDLPTGDVD